MGYRYGWYLMGPYCPALTRDYYELAQALDEGEADHQNVVLRPAVLQQLDRVKPLMSAPAEVSLDQSSWLELLASLHYLQKVRGLDEYAADKALVDAKPGLASWISAGRARLEACSLLP